MPDRLPIAPADGRLGVLIPGMGSVASTFIAGVALARRGLAQPIGSLTQLQKVRLGKRTSPREVARREHTRVQAAAQVTDELPRSCVLPAHATVVVDDVRRRPSRL